MQHLRRTCRKAGNKGKVVRKGDERAGVDATIELLSGGYFFDVGKLERSTVTNRAAHFI